MYRHYLNAHLVEDSTPARRLRALFRLMAWAERQPGLGVEVRALTLPFRNQFVMIYKLEEN